MLYYRCPTCRTLLANKQIPLEEGMEEICKNSKLTQSDKTQKISELLDKLEIKRYCCRMRVSYVKLVDIIS